MKNLPTHPKTGALLDAIYVSPRTGRKFYPILGAAEDDNVEEDAGDDDGGSEDEEDSTQDGKKPESKKEPEDDAGTDLGYPTDKPVAQMSDKEQAAYWKHLAQRDEKRVKGWSRVVQGKTADQLKAELKELEEHRRGKRTEHENAVEDAKKAAREEVASEYGVRLVTAELRGRLAHLEGVDKKDGADKRDRVISSLNLSSLLTEDGDVDTGKVKDVVADLAPSDTETTKRRTDYGGGRREDRKESGVAAGADAYYARHSKSKRQSEGAA